MELDLALEAVTDFPTFLAFAKLLQADREAAVAKERLHPSSPYESEYGWENTTIESFLEAAIAWSETTDCGVGQGTPPEQLVPIRIVPIRRQVL